MKNIVKKHEKIMKKRAKNTKREIEEIKKKYRNIMNEIAEILLYMKINKLNINNEEYDEEKIKIINIIINKKRNELNELKRKIRYVVIREKLYDIDKAKEASNEEIYEEMKKKNEEDIEKKIEEIIDYPLYGLEVRKRQNKAINYIVLKVEERINLGFIEDQTVEEIVELINYDLIKNYSSYENLYTTWTTFATYEAMKMFSGEKIMYNAILDSATCSVCWNLDGTIYNKGEEPTLPQHYRCRCFYSYL